MYLSVLKSGARLRGMLQDDTDSDDEIVPYWCVGIYAAKGVICRAEAPPCKPSRVRVPVPRAF